MRFEKIISIPKDELEIINRYLTLPNGLDDDKYQGEDNAITYTATFENGFFMDIKCCGCQDTASWTECVLFNPDGGQEAFSEPEVEFLGEWQAEDTDGNEYTVTVIVEEHETSKMCIDLGFAKLVTEKGADPNYKEIFISLETNDGAFIQDLAIVGGKYHYENDDVVQDKGISVKVYSDEYNEDYTHNFDIGIYKEKE